MNIMHGRKYLVTLISLLTALFVALPSDALQFATALAADPEYTYTNIESIYFKAEEWQNMNIPYSLPTNISAYSWELTFSDLTKINNRCASLVGAYNGNRSGYLYSNSSSAAGQGGTSASPSFLVCVGDGNKSAYFNIGGRSEKNTVHLNYTYNGPGNGGTWKIKDSLNIISTGGTPKTGTWTGSFCHDQFSLVACARYDYVNDPYTAKFEFASLNFYEVKIWEGAEGHEVLKIHITPVIRSHRTSSGLENEVGGYEHVSGQFVPLAGYAKSTISTFTITFDGCGASVPGTESVIAAFNSGLAPITIPQKNGWQFKGYYTMQNGGGVQYYDGEGNGVRAYDNAGDITLYAYWERDTQTESESLINYQDGYLHFNDSSVTPVRMYAYEADPINYTASGPAITSTYIDLGNETLVTDFSYNCYSLTGGKKWTYCSGGVKSKDIAKWFSSDCTILIADNYNKKLKRPDEGATVYYLGKTSRRPKLPVTRINYSHYRDDFAFTNGQWCLVDSNGKDIDFNKYEFMIQDSVGCTMAVDHSGSAQGTQITDYKAVIAAGKYGRWPGSGGVWIPNLDAKGRKQKAKILVRLTAKYDEESGIYSPASKSRKFTVTSVNKAPSVKIDYTKECIKLKKGMNMYFGSEIPTDSQGVPIAYPMPDDSEITSISDLEGTILINCSAQTASKGVNLTKYITETRNGLLVWQPATDRKPASAVSALQTAARRSIDSRQSVTVSATGRIDLAAEYEAFCNNKWIRALRISGNTTNILPVRIKGTAKGGKDGEGKYAPGVPGTLVLYYGTLANGKNGCTGAVIYPSGTTDEEIADAIAQWYGIDDGDDDD